MKLSAAVMAHPVRERAVDDLLLTLDRDVPVVWASNPQPSHEVAAEWRTGRAAWEQYDPAADWHLVLQDDAVPCQDLLRGAERALDQLGTSGIVSFYTGTGRPQQNGVRKALAHAREQRHSWLPLWSLNWGVAVCAPTWTIPGMLAWCEWEKSAYDARLASYYRDVKLWRTWYTLPSLVDHGDIPSLIRHGGGRFAHVMHEGSALDIDWSAHDGLPINLPQQAMEQYGLRARR